MREVFQVREKVFFLASFFVNTDRKREGEASYSGRKRPLE